MTTPDPPRWWVRAVPVAWSSLLAVLLLGPALGPGYVLSFDMVWVPDLVLRADVLGVGSSLPRAVPSDAVVAVLDEVLPGALLQDLVLLAALVVGGLGVDRLLVPLDLGLAARLAALTLWQWNPYVVERLVLGHWPVLVGYAALPWVLHGASRWRAEGRCPAWLLLVVPLGSLSVSAGLATSLALLVVLAAGRAQVRRLLAAGGLALAGQAPWLVSGLLHAGAAVTDGEGAALFALSDEGLLPAPLAALSVGGVWNAAVVPDSREGVLAVVGLLVLSVLAALGLASLLRGRGTSARALARPLAVLWLVGWALAVLTWAAPGAVHDLSEVLPGAGVLRDGARLLLLCVPLLVLLVALAVDDAARRLRAVPLPAPAVVVLVGALVLLPVTVLPDAALGVAGRLDAVEYPSSYAGARAALQEAAPDGDVLVLPLSSYRAPDWNGGRPVLDPLPRQLVPVPIASDDLVVDDVTVAGEDPRVRDARAALAQPDPASRAAALGRLGIAAVAEDLTAPGPRADVAGEQVWADERLRVVVLPQVEPRSVPTGWVVVMVLAWAAYLGLPTTGLVLALVRRRRGVDRSRGASPTMRGKLSG
ncbi:hypothetical protein [Nocardioides sp.]|uniref:hypothetical protein n=1 Tax=Nocardioides sp. TaxID=35761 RepID=UPI00262FCE07|nr:hypothetical protein [Nocardioides sp.]